MRSLKPLQALSLAPFLFCAAALADEGMWLVNKPPLQTLKEKYNFAPSQDWLNHMQGAAVDPGASGSFVSANGLVMTNHHVASTSIEQISTAQANYIKDGFLASSLDKEIKLPEMELTMLVSIEDVTAKVTAGTTPGDTSPAAAAKRREAIAAIESAETARTGLQCRVVTLYQGGLYHLYNSRRFTDVRLVFAPEMQAAFYGGDAANFEFPRFDFDVTFLRVYDNDKPYRPQHFLSWSTNGAAEGDLAIVFGHPGRTQRLLTADHLRFIRDVDQPTALAHLWRAEKKMEAFAGRSAENARVASDEIFGLANSRKARTGMLAGLHDPALFGHKTTAEQALRAAVAANPQWAGQYAKAWDAVSNAYTGYRPWFPRHRFVTRGLEGSVAGDVLAIVLMTEELAKPSAERYREFTDASLESTRFGLFSPAPLYAGFENAKLAASLSELAERFGAEDPLVKSLLNGMSPTRRAEECIRATKLLDHEARKKLAESGPSGVRESTDPLVVLARAMAPEYRALRKRYEDEVESVERAAYAQIAAARFAIDADKVYPDATGSLRMTFGPVSGYTEDGAKIRPFTTMAELFETANRRAPDPQFALTPRWAAAQKALNPTTPMNFVCACDIIGGNSGSPVVNTKGEVIGLIFDGNIQSLPGAYHYDGAVNRAVAVDSRGIIEGLRVVYRASALADELVGSK